MPQKKWKLILIGYLVMLLSLTSCFNVFSIFNPSDPAGVQDVNSLIAIGDRYMANMDYENAYKAYSNAYVINPTNSLVIEGLCTSYLFWQIPITNVITSIISGKFESLSKNKFYNVTAFIAPKMATILKGKATSEIAANDMTISVHYFLYNTLYAVFYLADSDGDMNLQNDSNDFITFTNDGFGFSYNIPNQTNFVEVIKLMNVVNKNLKVFRAFVKESSNVLIVIQNSVSSKQAKDFVGQVTNFVFGTMKELNTQLSAFENITGTNQFSLLSSSDITNLLAKQGFGSNDYSLFTNAMASAGMTNMSVITNLFPDMTNFNSLISNYFHL